MAMRNKWGFPMSVVKVLRREVGPPKTEMYEQDPLPGRENWAGSYPPSHWSYDVRWKDGVKHVDGDVCPMGIHWGARDETPTEWRNFPHPDLTETDIKKFAHVWDLLNLAQAKEAAKFIWPGYNPDAKAKAKAKRRKR